MGCITTHTTHIGGIRTKTKRATNPQGFTARREGGTLQVRASLVCTIDTVAKYVRVEPQYVWLTESNLFHAIVEVQSNTTWKAG